MISSPHSASRSPIRTLLVDDEPLARQRMRMLLGRHPDVQVLAECADGPEAVTAIEAFAPDLVFLDVEMPTLDGFGVLENLADGPLPSIVFVSGHDQYAVKAFETHAIDYLLKPVAADRVDRTLQRIRAQRAPSAAPGTPDEAGVRALVSQLRSGEVEVGTPGRRGAGRIAVKTDGQLLLLGQDEIAWVEAEGNYVRVHARGTTFDMRETMKRMEQRLDPGRFVRIHRGAIINIDHVDALEPWQHGEYVVHLRDGTRLMASRVFVGRLKALIAT